MPDERQENRELFTSEQKLEIAEALGNEEAVDEVIEATLWYLVGLQTLDKSRTKTPALDAATEINDLASRLASVEYVLRDLSMQARISLTRALGDVEQFAEVISGYEIAARNAALQLREGAPTNKKGRPTKSAQDVLLKRLASIYETATKRVATVSRNSITNELSGPYFRFVRLCTAELPGVSELTDEGLFSAIRKARKGE